MKVVLLWMELKLFLIHGSRFIHKKKNLYIIIADHFLLNKHLLRSS